jgi:hypothetical protein
MSEALKRRGLAPAALRAILRGMTHLLALLAIAQDAPIDYGDALTELIKLAQTFHGASAIGITVIVVQALMLGLRTPLAEKLGKWKLTALLGLSCVTSLLSAKLAGATWGAALLSGPLLAAGQVFAHQLYAQFTEKKS